MSLCLYYYFFLCDQCESTVGYVSVCDNLKNIELRREALKSELEIKESFLKKLVNLKKEGDK